MMNKMNDKDLEKVNGGTAYILEGRDNIRVCSGPGSKYDTAYRVNSGDMVFTRGMSLFNSEDGFEWEELTDGNWIPKGVLV